MHNIEINACSKKFAASELRYRRLFETAQDGIILLDFKTGMILDINQFLIDMLGYTKKDVLRKHLWNIGAFKDMVASKKNYKILQTKRYIRFEDLPLRAKDGRTIDVEFVANAYTVGDEIIIQCNIRDIRDRKAAVDALLVNEKNFRAIFDHSSIGISIVSLDGRWLQVNSALCRITGYSKTELLSTTYLRLTLPEDIEKTKQFSKDLLRGKRTYGSLEKRYKTKQGKIIWVNISAAIAKDAKGKPKYFIVHTEDITDRKISLEKKYQTIFQSSADAIMTLHPPTWKFVTANAAAIKMFNCKDEKEFAALGPWNVSPKKQPNGRSSSSEAKKMISWAMRDGSAFFEWTHKRQRDGNFPATVLLSRVVDDKKTYLQATVRDISKEKRAEEELKMSEEKYRNIIESSRDLIFTINADYRYISINTALAKNFGKTVDRLIGKSLFDIFPKAQALKLRHNVDTVFKTKKPLALEETINVRGHELYNSTLLHPITDKNGKVTAVSGIVRDVTERHLLDLALKHIRDAKDKIILSSIGDGVLATDADGRIIVFNKVASQITGYSSEEAIGRLHDKILCLRHEDSDESHVDIISKAIHEGKTIPMMNHTVLIKKDGTKVPVADSAAPYFDQHNKVAGCVVVFRDATHERDIDRAKTEFVSLASHQLRTPLASIRWISELLLQNSFGEITDKQREGIEMLHNSSTRLVDLISALLNVSRLELGTFYVRPKKITLGKIADQIVQELDQQIKNKMIKIRKQYPAGKRTIYADPILTKIIMQNLIVNAVRYSYPESEIVITILKEKDRYVITVKNHGIGIPENERSKIFTKMFRASNARLVETDGTGLGLYIAKSIVDSIGGDIWFEDVMGRYTTFSVALPLQGMKAKAGSKNLEI